MKNNICVIGLGSNIEPEENITRAIKLIKEEAMVLSISSFKVTKPIGIIEQPDFMNGAVKISTQLPIARFNQFLKAIEDRMGRDRTVERFGPRNIDLDIVVWNGKIIDQDYYKRDFLKNSVDELI